MPKAYKATLRTVDGFQEVVLPPETHLENDEYVIRRDEKSGALILSEDEPKSPDFQKMFDEMDAWDDSDEGWWRAFEEALSEARGRPLFGDH